MNVDRAREQLVIAAISLEEAEQALVNASLAAEGQDTYAALELVRAARRMVAREEERLAP